MKGYDEWLLRGSGAYSTERDYDLPEPCEDCGTTEATLFVDDFGSASVICENGHENPVPEPDDEPDEPDEPDYWERD